VNRWAWLRRWTQVCHNRERRVGGSPGRIVPCDSISIKIAVANVGLAIEAVPEQLELKKEIFLRTSAVGRQDLRPAEGL
jgi:3-hydroxyacyl-CoA dehydrogenase